MLSGNRNFEGRISPDVKMNYLASPPLVIAYALAGTMDFDFESEPLGQDKDGNDVFLKDIWPSPKEIQETIDSSINQEMFTNGYADVFKGDERWQLAADAGGQDLRVGRRTRPTCASPRTSTACRRSRTPVTDIQGARVLALLGDSVTTDHISPGRARSSPAPRPRSTSIGTASSARTTTPSGRGAATTR